MSYHQVFFSCKARRQRKFTLFWQKHYGTTVKNWVAQFKRDFSTCDAPHPAWPKTVTTSEITDQIHELIFEDRQISAKSTAEHLKWAGWVHHSWRFGHAEALHEVGPKMPESGSKMSMVPVVWATLEFFQHDPNDFLSRLVTMDETWSYHYDLDTKQPWSGGIATHPTPKNSECKNPLEKFWPWIFGIKMASSSFVIF